MDNRDSREDAIEYWLDALGDDKPRHIMSVMQPVPHAQEDKYGSDGILVKGNPEFVKEVLRRLKDMLDSESAYTKLCISTWPVPEGYAFAGNLNFQIHAKYRRVKSNHIDFVPGSSERLAKTRPDIVLRYE